MPDPIPHEAANRAPLCRPGRCDNDVPLRRHGWYVPLCLECCPNDPPPVLTWADLVTSEWQTRQADQ